MDRKIGLGFALGVVLGVGGPAMAQQAVQWRVEDGGNGHWYQLVPRENRTWSQLQAEAVSKGAHLATVSTAAENAFIVDVGFPHLCFLGGFRDGGVCGAPWQWVDGSPFAFTSWEPGQPQCTGEDAIAMYTTASFWHDFPRQPECCVGAAVFEWSADCNEDGVIDYTQVLAGDLADVNESLIPDVCEWVMVPNDRPTIQAAVNAGVDGTIIRVNPGVYAPFDLGDKRIIVESTGGSEVTFIDASEQGTSAVRFGPNSTFISTVRGFTIRTGIGSLLPGDPAGTRVGGGLYLHAPLNATRGASATIEDCVFVGSSTGCDAGTGIFAMDANIAVRRCRFVGLAATQFGPAIAVRCVPEPTVPGTDGLQTLIEDCVVEDCSGGQDSGIRIDLSSFKIPMDVVVRRSEFSRNSGSLLAGALFAQAASTGFGGRVLVDRCVFHGNTAFLAKSIGVGLLGGTQALTVALRRSVVEDPAPAVLSGLAPVSLEDTYVCTGLAAIQAPLADLGGNRWSCPLPTDCDHDGRIDLHQVALGLADDADGNGIPDSCEECPADVNRSGVVNAVDISMILSAWGTDGGKFPRTDTNGDGTVDAMDLAVVLSGWGDCP